MTCATTAAPVVETISDLAGFDEFGSEWNELLSASGSAGLFLTWEWLHTWWKHQADGRRLAILAIRSEGRLIGLAPCCARPASLRDRRPIPLLEFLGTGCVGSDYLDLIVREGWEDDAREALAASFAERHQAIDWRQLRQGCFAHSVALDLEHQSWNLTESVTNVCPFITLSGHSWESYLATLGAEHRYNFNRKWRRLNRDYCVTFERVDRADRCRESIDLAMDLHNNRWSGRGSDAFNTPALMAFHREFSQLALRRGWLRLYFLRLNETPVACLYGFLYDGVFSFYQSGFDPAFQKQSVGLVAMGLAIQSAIEEGAREYDLLHGNEEYKSHWSREQRELTRCQLYPPGAAGNISRRLAQAERRARRIARKALTGLSA